MRTSFFVQAKLDLFEEFCIQNILGLIESSFSITGTFAVFNILSDKLPDLGEAKSLMDTNFTAP